MDCSEPWDAFDDFGVKEHSQRGRGRRGFVTGKTSQRYHSSDNTWQKSRGKGKVGPKSCMFVRCVLC